MKHKEREREREWEVENVAVAFSSRSNAFSSKRRHAAATSTCLPEGFDIAYFYYWYHPESFLDQRAPAAEAAPILDC
jgi:hypothetical protein